MGNQQSTTQIAVRMDIRAGEKRIDLGKESRPHSRFARPEVMGNAMEQHAYIRRMQCQPARCSVEAPGNHGPKSDAVLGKSVPRFPPSDRNIDWRDIDDRR